MQNNNLEMRIKSLDDNNLIDKLYDEMTQYRKLTVLGGRTPEHSVYGATIKYLLESIPIMSQEYHNRFGNYFTYKKHNPKLKVICNE